MSPASGCSKPAIMRSVVVLPQPEGPSREMNSPRLDREVEAVDGDDSAETLRQLAQLNRALFATHVVESPLSPIAQREAHASGRAAGVFQTTEHAASRARTQPRTSAETLEPGVSLLAVRPLDGAPSRGDRPGCSLCGRPTYDPGKRDASMGAGGRGRAAGADLPDVRAGAPGLGRRARSLLRMRRNTPVGDPGRGGVPGMRSHGTLGRLAQLAERRPYKAKVGGSRPSAPTERTAGRRRGYTA